MVATTTTGIDSRTLAADAVEAASTAVKDAVTLRALDSELGLLAQYTEAKRALDAAEARVKALKPRVNDLFVARGADKFTNTAGDVLMARVECDNPQAYDMDLLARLAPKALAKATKPKTKHFRLNLPRIKA